MFSSTGTEQVHYVCGLVLPQAARDLWVITGVMVDGSLLAPLFGFMVAKLSSKGRARYRVLNETRYSWTLS